MYVPEHFAMPAGELRSMLSAMDAADLVTVGPDGLVATFLPLLWEPPTGSTGDGVVGGRLLGHVARNNPHWRAAGGREDSMVIVRGPDGYISPSWYASKAEHGRVVPTWNYVTAHLYGRLVAHDDTDWLRALVTRLTDRHESRRAQPWQVTDAPAPFLDGQLRAIVGVELSVSRVEAKAKLSQNRPAADQDGVRAGLRAQGRDAERIGPPEH